MNDKPPLSEGELITGIIRILSEADRWIVVTHCKPDGDTLGSGSAFLALGESMGKKVAWGGPDPFPEIYGFLYGADRYVPDIAPDFPALKKGDAVIVLDTSTRERSVHGIDSVSETVPIVNIDHHHDNERFGSIAWVDASASSTGEMCWLLFKKWGTAFSPEAAEALYTAIVTDSGNFTFSCTTSRTHEAAGELLDCGVSPEKLDCMIRCSRSTEGLHLRGRALERIFPVGGTAACTWLTLQDFIDTGSDPSETEGLVNELLTLRSVSFAALLVEEEDKVRASFRSRGGISAAKAAHRFGGGGHPQAAGCSLPLPLEEALQSVADLLEDTDGLRTSPSE